MSNRNKEQKSKKAPSTVQKGGTGSSQSSGGEGQHSLLMAQQVTHYEGPIPDPETLNRYEQIAPGTAERIIAMAEKEQSHRHEIESTVVSAQTSDVRDERKAEARGQWFALFFCTMAIAAGAYSIHAGHPGWGIVLCGATLASVVGIFITRRNGKNDTPPNHTAEPTPTEQAESEQQ
jgi:uncharacterized membrane protein